MALKKKIRICEECGKYYRPRPGTIYWCEDCDTGRFVRVAKSVHGEKYDYCLAEYATNKQKVKIICSEHGIFMQTPHKHLKGAGCPDCAGGKTDK